MSDRLDPLVEKVQQDSFRFFPSHANPDNGLVRDSTQQHTPSSIASVGFALTCYPIAVRQGWMSRADALARTLATLRFFAHADQSGSPESAGYRGFFFHFLDMHSGRRAWKCELSTIDTTLLVAGMLLAARFFDGDSDEESEVRSSAAGIYERVDWRWAQNDGAALSLGWTPERGFLRFRWIGYSEALLLYALALGSPTHAASLDAYGQWLSGYRWKRIYGRELVYAGPLFIHQFSH
ncbi:MAG: glucoamylase family protein, partial [Gammaproteobacteria bacterium]